MDLSDLLPLTFMTSRIPALDALAGFVPSGDESASWVTKTCEERGQSRWAPVEGGHRVLFFYEGGPYDAGHFVVEPGAWDHEHCARCAGTIAPMTLCWVTESGPFLLLCENCHAELERFRSARA